jgi:hypothetical protein
MQILVNHIKSFYKSHLFKKNEIHKQPVKLIIEKLVNDGNI